MTSTDPAVTAIVHAARDRLRTTVAERGIDPRYDHAEYRSELAEESARRTYQDAVTEVHALPRMGLDRVAVEDAYFLPWGGASVELHASHVGPAGPDSVYLNVDEHGATWTRAHGEQQIDDATVADTLAIDPTTAAAARGRLEAPLRRASEVYNQVLSDTPSAITFDAGVETGRDVTSAGPSLADRLDTIQTTLQQRGPTPAATPPARHDVALLHQHVTAGPRL